MSAQGQVRTVDGTVKGMTSGDVVAAIRRRHPSAPQGRMVAQWTTLTEWQGIDAVAFDAWGNGERIGYEVKVSRSDLRRELLAPHKREPYKACVHRLYLATPAGLLTMEEKEYKQPADWALEDFERPRCTNPECRESGVRHRSRRGRSSRYSTRRKRLAGHDEEGMTVSPATTTFDMGDEHVPGYYIGYGCCNICKGTGETGKSRVELEGPTLWIPPDVGLLEVHADRTLVVRRAPKLEPSMKLSDKTLAQAVRWASNRPDPNSGWKSCNKP